MYDSKRKEFYWPRMTSDVYATVQDWRSCSQDCLYGKKQSLLKLFFPDHHLEFVRMGILRSLSKTKQRNQLVVVVTDRRTKLTKAITTTKAITALVARIFLEHLVANFLILSKLLTDDGPQFLSKFSLAVCSKLVVNSINSTEYHPQRNGEAERFNFTSVSRLCY